MTLRFVVLSAAAVTSVTLLLAIQVFVARALLLARSRRSDRCRRFWEPQLIQAVAVVPAVMPPLDRRDVFTFLSLWNHLQECVLDDAKQRLNRVAYMLDVPRLVHRMLERGNLRERLMAITTLGQLGDRSVWNALCACVESPQVVVSLAAARALIQIDRRAAIEHLMPLIVSRMDWPPARVANLLKAAGPDVISEPLARAAMAAPSDQAPRLIRYLDVIHCETAIPAVRQILRSTDNAEVIAACLRIFQDPEDLDVVRRLLDHPGWEVRVRAAIALGRMGTPADEPRLSRLLADREWWVRYRAAHALHILLADHPERLEHLRTSHPNPFGRDILTHVHAERTVR